MVEFKRFKTFKLFNPLPLSFPASRRVAGEDEGGGFNDLSLERSELWI